MGEWRYSFTHSLTAALDGGEWSASHPSRFTPRERVRGTHWIGGWVGPRAVLDAVVWRKIPNPAGNRTQDILKFESYYLHGENCAKINIFSLSRGLLGYDAV
jgi:hypothetical protein